MKILIDTSIWSIALRRRKPTEEGSDQTVIIELKELIREGRAVIIGPVRQELLSGITNQAQFEKLKKRLKPFEDLPISTMDYERAAEFYNLSRSKGVQGSFIDFLICSVAKNNNLAIFTFDKDFKNYAQILDLSLHIPRNILNLC